MPITDDQQKWLSDIEAAVPTGNAGARDALAKLRADLDKSFDDSGISDFFSSITAGVVGAQKALDQQSLEYMRSKPAFAPATMYRVPTVSANLKLGLKQSQGKKINFFIFGSDESDSKSLEQEISFEIAAVPAPPEALTPLAVHPLSPWLVQDQDERADAFNKLRAALAIANSAVTKQTERDAVTAILAPETRSRVLIFNDRDENMRLFLLVGSDGAIECAGLSRTESAWTTASGFYAYVAGGKAAAKVAVLGEVVLPGMLKELADIQAVMLTPRQT